MEGGKAWPFFLFWLDLPDVASDSESEKLNESPQSIGVLLSCFCRTVSSLWRPMSLASSSVTLELACTNFSSAFWQWSRLAEAFSSANLTLSVRLLWRSLYYSTFYQILRMLHPQFGELCSAMQFRRPFWPPLMVFLLSAPSMPLHYTKCMLHTCHIPHNALW